MKKNSNRVVGALFGVIALGLFASSATVFLLHRRKSPAIVIGETLSRRNLESVENTIDKDLPGVKALYVVEFSLSFDEEDSLTQGFINFTAETENQENLCYQLNKGEDQAVTLIPMGEEEAGKAITPAYGWEEVLGMVEEPDVAGYPSQYSFEYTTTELISPSESSSTCNHLLKDDSIIEIDSLVPGNYLCVSRMNVRNFHFDYFYKAF